GKRGHRADIAVIAGTRERQSETVARRGGAGRQRDRDRLARRGAGIFERDLGAGGRAVAAGRDRAAAAGHDVERGGGRELDRQLLAEIGGRHDHRAGGQRAVRRGRTDRRLFAAGG